ncbi:MAG TPA: lysine-sensitive aspartokinase 3 [Pyrinomonadaceae bacterium]|nr:lysine-sensitive aspartokinase 3 [Pyrinomonadaceae bacterium]
MNPTIIKFGGTSVEDAPAFLRATEIIDARRALRPVVVVSAISGMTDALIASMRVASHQQMHTAVTLLKPHFERHLEASAGLLAEAQARDFHQQVEKAQSEVCALLETISRSKQAQGQLSDSVLSYGERLSSLLLTAVLRARGCDARTVDARQVVITDDQYGCAAPLFKETFEKTRSTLSPLLDAGLIPVLGGFVGSTLRGETTTLGRGGSDYTAALVGAALGANEIQIWTDVSGVLTADPRIVPQAQPIRRLSYGEAAELAYFGAKVLHPKTIQPAVENSIPVRICNSHLPEEDGTLVAAETEASPRTVKSIAHKTGVTTIQITSARMLGAYGFLRALFEVFDRHRTAVDVVTTSEVSVSLSLDDVAALTAITRELEELGAVRVERGRAIICVVGEGLCGTPGIAAKVFNTISDINVTLISQGASSINLTFAIEEGRVGEAVCRLHEAFFEVSGVENAKANSFPQRRKVAKGLHLT